MCAMLIHGLLYMIDITKRWDDVITLPEAEEGGKTAKKPTFGRT